MTRAEAFLRLLGESECCKRVSAQTESPRPTLADLERKGLLPEVRAVYDQLGGLAAAWPFGRPGKWDGEVDHCELGHLTLELDEEQHFNLYREITLRSPLYERLSFNVGSYIAYCREHGQACMGKAGYGGYWTSDSTEKMFGIGGPPKVLPPGTPPPNGAPRWKQRALYDFLKDLTPLCFGSSLSRVAVWEALTAGGITKFVGAWLDDFRAGRHTPPDLPNALCELVKRCQIDAR